MNKPLDKLKTGAFSRHLSLAKASLNIGKNFAKHTASNLFSNIEDKQKHHQEFLQQQADYLAKELGNLKGSVVKIGQMLALYGENVLPKPIIQALHTLDNQTTTLNFSVIYDAIYAQIGDKINELQIEKIPIGTASLAQVHKAVIKDTGQILALKVQYPGVAEAIDSDLSLFKKLLKLTQVIPQTKVLDAWFDEVSQLLHREVDYKIEAKTTKRFHQRLEKDTRFVVPTIFDEYSTHKLLAMSFEEGVPLSHPSIQSLSQTQRNQLGKAALDVMMQELFCYQEMQTDPNFGNYLVRIDGESTKLVLLDFGAIKQFDDDLCNMAQAFIKAGHYQSSDMMLKVMNDSRYHYEFLAQMNQTIKCDMAEVFLIATESFAKADILVKTKPEMLDNGRYIWSKSNIYNEAVKRASIAMRSREFSMPPKEMMFISRKFIGAYAFLSAIDARVSADELLAPYV